MNRLRLMLPDPTALDDECAACGEPVHTGVLLCAGCDDRADTEADLRYERAQDWSGDE